VPLLSDNNKSLASEPVSTGILEPDEKAQISYTGLSFSLGGSRICYANVSGDIKVFCIQPDYKVTALFSFALPPASRGTQSPDPPNRGSG